MSIVEYTPNPILIIKAPILVLQGFGLGFRGSSVRARGFGALI